jgi:hypothetical protein
VIPFDFKETFMSISPSKFTAIAIVALSLFGTTCALARFSSDNRVHVQVMQNATRGYGAPQGIPVGHGNLARTPVNAP